MREEKIKEILEQLGGRRIRSSSRQVRCLCPFHDEKYPSFYVKIENNGLSPYHCFGCGVSGILEYLVSEKKIRARLIRENWNSLRESLRPAYLEKYLEKLTKYRPDFLRERKIPEKILTQFKVRFDKFNNSVVFPVYNHYNVLVGIIQWNPFWRTHYLFNPRFKKNYVLYGENLLKIEKDIILVEGVFDCLRLRSFGENSLALLGTSFSEEQEKKLRMLRIKFGIKKIFVMLDGDNAGDEGSQLIIRKNPDFIRISTPRGKDPDDLTKEEYLELIKKAGR